MPDSLEGIKIVQLSDLHWDGPERKTCGQVRDAIRFSYAYHDTLNTSLSFNIPQEYLQRAVAMVNQQKPDLIVITGGIEPRFSQ